MSGRAAAFVDVDQTLLTRSGLADFLAFHLLDRFGAELGTLRLARLRRQLRFRAAAGESREGLCRLLHATLAGADVDAVHDQVRRWFAAADDGSLFHEPVRRHLEAHAARGDLVVLVSGSFAACLAPVVERTRADRVRCSEPRVVAGAYTGELAAPMVGAAKAGAVRDLAASEGIDLRRSWAYGDHSSDLPMLRRVGHPVVVGDDLVLRRCLGDSALVLPAAGGASAPPSSPRAAGTPSEGPR